MVYMRIGCKPSGQSGTRGAVARKILHQSGSDSSTGMRHRGAAQDFGEGQGCTTDTNGERPDRTTLELWATFMLPSAYARTLITYAYRQQIANRWPKEAAFK